MKNKFLITNDVGLSFDKVQYLYDEMKSCGGELYGLDHVEVFEEVLSHLQQAMDNLGETNWVR